MIRRFLSRPVLYRTSARFISNYSRKTPFTISAMTVRRFSKNVEHSSWVRRALVGTRKWGMDDFFALFSWIFVGNAFLFLLRTTTVVSILFLTISYLPIEDYVVKSLADYITNASGVKTTINGKVTKNENKLRLNNVVFEIPGTEKISKFHIEISAIDVGLDLVRFFRGFGFISDLKLYSVRGLMDRRGLNFDVIDTSTWAIKRKAHPGDLNLDSFEIENCLFTVLDINGYRPYSILIHQAKLNRFRTQWLLYDFLDAETIVGEFDGSLFSLSKPKFFDADNHVLPHHQKLPWKKASLRNQRMSLLRVSSLNIDILNRGDKGPFGWITQGQLDLDVVYMIPLDEEKYDDTEDDMFSDELLTNRMHEELKNLRDKIITDSKPEISEDIHDRKKYLDLQIDRLDRKELNDILLPPTNNDDTDGKVHDEENSRSKYTDRRIPFYADVKLHHIRANLPPDPQLSGVPNFLVRPIIAYFNAQPTSPRYRKSSTPPLSCLFTLNESDLDGSWTLLQAGISERCSRALCDALVARVQSEFQSFIDRGKRQRAPSDNKKDDLVEEFEEYYSNIDGNERNGRLISRVGWFSFQQLIKRILAHYGGEFNVPRDPEDEQFINLYEEIVNAKR